MLPVKRGVLLTGAVALACGPSAPPPEKPPTEIAIESAPDSDADSSAPPAKKPGTDRGAVPFRFPLGELFEALDAEKTTLAELAVELHGRRQQSGLTNEIDLELKGHRVFIKTSSKGETASSVQLKLVPPERLIGLLRACSEGRAQCRPPDPAESTEPWHEFQLELTIEHSELGRFEESPEAARVLVRLVEEAFRPAPPPP